jgi:hypothetical protein
MSTGIGGQKRETRDSQDYVKKIGLFEGEVICINPTVEQYKDILGIELKEDSRAAEYLGESKDGNTTLRLSFWLKDVKSQQNFNVSFYLEDKERTNKDGSKNQYINQIGMCSWGSSEDELAVWFKGSADKPRDFRVAYVGEEELYEFLRNWLSQLDFSKHDTVLSLDWKKLMRGNIKELTSQINGEYSTNVVCMATVTTREVNGEVKEYQSVYNKAFLPSYSLKQFRLKDNDFNDRRKIEALGQKKSKDLRPHERFALKLTGEYGCKDYFVFGELQDYNPEMNMAASEKVIADDDADY